MFETVIYKINHNPLVVAINKYSQNLRETFSNHEHILIIFAIISLVSFCFGAKQIIASLPVLHSYWQRAKSEGYTFSQFLVNNIHNVGAFCMVLAITLACGYFTYYSSQQLKAIDAHKKEEKSLIHNKNSGSVIKNEE